MCALEATVVEASPDCIPWLCHVYIDDDVLVQILKGNLNLVNTTFPVLMFEPRSYLQKLADIWAYPDYINAAAAQQDPLERMKLLVTWMVAGEHTPARSHSRDTMLHSARGTTSWVCPASQACAGIVPCAG
jgi:hypothetical protein